MGRDPRKSAAESLRSAVDKTFSATVGQAEVTKGRAQEIVDEVVEAANSAASRVRDAIEEIRTMAADDPHALHARLDNLEARIARLEKGSAAASRPAPKRKPAAASRPAPKRKPAARKSPATAKKSTPAASARSTKR